MPSSENWPFKRVMVDHMVRGISRVWWQLVDGFTDSFPRQFQLQVGNTGMNSALDWVDAGSAATDAWYLEHDDVREPAGKVTLTHYRVVLTTPENKYVSGPAPVQGLLNNKDWNYAREMIRKERLRLSMTGVEIYLLKRFRAGVVNPDNTDYLTGGITDSSHPQSFGTRFKVGYHPPFSLTIDSDNISVDETRGGDDPPSHSQAMITISPRMVAIPLLNDEDVIVDASTDNRWVVNAVQTLATWRGVPLVIQPVLSLLPRSHIAYRIPVDATSYEPNSLWTAPTPTRGTGCVEVDHDYPTEDNLRYYDAEGCCGIAGATILIFTAADWEGAARTPEHAVASSQTTTNGQWAWSVLLDPGNYYVQFESPGRFGPDVVQLTVTNPGVADSSSSFGSF